MPRYEFHDEKSAKFWEITLEGTGYTVTYGRIGTEGQTKTKDFGDAGKALKARDKIIASKVKKGYVLVESAPAGSLTDARHPELEAAIVADPSSKEAWAVYGDWLQSQGDVRGEIIALELEGKSSDALLAANRAQLLGDFAAAFDAMSKETKGWGDNALIQLKWRYGFVTEALIGSGYDAEHDTADMLASFFACPAGRFVQTVRIGLPEHDGQADFGAVIGKVVETGPHPSVRALHLGDFEYPDETEISWTEVGDVTPLVAACPNLRDFHVTGGGIELKPFSSDTLESLWLETGGLTGGVAQAVSNSTLPALKRLEIWLGAEDYGAGTTPDELRGIMSGEKQPQLVELAIKNGEIMDQVAAMVAESAILKRLQTLDLSMGTMVAEGARAILDNQARFAHLKRLDVSSNCIPEDLENALRAAFGDRLVAGDQEDIDDYGYVSVGE